MPASLEQVIRRAVADSVATASAAATAPTAVADLEDATVSAVVSFLKQNELSDSDKSLLLYRYILLQYLDRLRTYNKLSGMIFAELVLGLFMTYSLLLLDYFDKDEYAVFRNSNLINEAVKYAKDEDTAAVDVRT